MHVSDFSSSGIAHYWQMYCRGIDSHCDKYSTYLCCSLVRRPQISRKYVSVAYCVALNIAKSHSRSIFGERMKFF